jgi:hypothetical protein
MPIFVGVGADRLISRQRAREGVVVSQIPSDLGWRAARTGGELERIAEWKLPEV